MIIPALLTTNPRIAEERIKLAQHMSGWLHIDLLDNTLYDFASLSLEELAKLDYGDLSIELHSMTDSPEAALATDLSFDRFILHIEVPDWEKHYDRYVAEGIDTWLAISPETDIAQLSIPQDCTGVVLMGVTPGQTGQSFLESTYERLDTLLEYHPTIPITIDGGVSADNLRALTSYGIDNVIMGSALFGQPNPAETYQQLTRLVDPIAEIDDQPATKPTSEEAI
jgi:ribulose-phosphate 3-epimerase